MLVLTFFSCISLSYSIEGDLFNGAQIKRDKFEGATDSVACVSVEEKRHPSSAEISVAVVTSGNSVNLRVNILQL